MFLFMELHLLTLEGLYYYQILEIEYGMCKSNARKRAFPYDCTTKTAAVFCRNDFEHVYAHNFWTFYTLDLIFGTHEPLYM